jgi:hypothetical protein
MIAFPAGFCFPLATLAQFIIPIKLFQNFTIARLTIQYMRIDVVRYLLYTTIYFAREIDRIT